MRYDNKWCDTIEEWREAIDCAADEVYDDNKSWMRLLGNKDGNGVNSYYDIFIHNGIATLYIESMKTHMTWVVARTTKYIRDQEKQQRKCLRMEKYPSKKRKWCAKAYKKESQ